MTGFEPTMGHWWVEAHPDRGLPGYLEFNPDDTAFPWRLTVNGELCKHPEPGYGRELTVFGDTPFGMFTLQEALPAVMYGRSPHRMVRWEGMQLIRGAHCSRAALFESASFRLPHLWHWLGPSQLNDFARPRPVAEDADEPILCATAALADGIQLELWRTFTESMEPLGRMRKREWHAEYSIRCASGFTLESAERAAYGLSLLHSVVMDAPMDSFEWRLLPLGGSWDQRVEIVEAHPPAGTDWTGLAPFLDTAEVEFESFVQSWLRLHADAPIVVESAAPPRQSRQVATSRLVETCNAVEALASRAWARPSLRPQDIKILDALKSGGASTRDRKAVEGYLRQRSWPLDAKLERVARSIGEQSSDWLLGSVIDWAYLVMRLRNTVSHGSPLPDGLSHDVEFVIEAQRSLAAVLRLAVLRACGYTNPLGPGREELLWSARGVAASHRNSRTFRELEGVAASAPLWPVWRTRLERAAHPPA